MTDPLTPEERAELRELCERTNREGFFETEFVNAIDPDDILRLLDQVEAQAELIEEQAKEVWAAQARLFETEAELATLRTAAENVMYFAEYNDNYGWWRITPHTKTDEALTALARVLEGEA